MNDMTDTAHATAREIHAQRPRFPGHLDAREMAARVLGRRGRGIVNLYGFASGQRVWGPLSLNLPLFPNGWN